jgi:putative transposase
MKSSKFSEVQIAFVLKQAEDGTAIGEVYRKCIRPLASGLLLQPGHDENRARRFHKTCSGTKPAFSEGFRAR